MNVLAVSLRNSEEMFAKAFGSSPVGIVIVKLSGGVFVDVNDSFVKISGLSRLQVVGRAITEMNLFLTPADYDRMVQVLIEKGLLRNF